MGTEHIGFIKYFKRHRFGSEPPVMSILSLLPPKDRCEILEEIRAFDPNNIHVFDKLSMAYMKSGRMEQGLQLLIQPGLCSRVRCEGRNHNGSADFTEKE